MTTGVDNTILAIVAIAAAALAVQTIGMLAVLFAVRKAAKNLRDELEHYRSTLSPMILKARDVMQNVAPKVELAAEELAAITTSLREQTAEIQVATTDIIARTQHQVGRADHMLSAVFDRVERAGAFVSDAVAKPMRQLSGLVASFRAVVDTLRDPDSGHVVRPPQAATRYPEAEPISTPRAAGASAPIRP